MSDDEQEETAFIWDTVDRKRLANGTVINPRNYVAVGNCNEELQVTEFEEEERERHEAEKAKQ